MRIRVQVEVVCYACPAREWVWSVVQVTDELDRIPADLFSIEEKSEGPPGWRMARRTPRVDEGEVPGGVRVIVLSCADCGVGISPVQWSVYFGRTDGVSADGEWEWHCGCDGLCDRLSLHLVPIVPHDLPARSDG